MVRRRYYHLYHWDCLKLQISLHESRQNQNPENEYIVQAPLNNKETTTNKQFSLEYKLVQAHLCSETKYAVIRRGCLKCKLFRSHRDTLISPANVHRACSASFVFGGRCDYENRDEFWLQFFVFEGKVSGNETGRLIKHFKHGRGQGVTTGPNPYSILQPGLKS